MAGALFGNSASTAGGRSGAGGSGGSKNLIEFRAGKMTMKGKMVHADKRKGLLYLYQSDEGLMHFCWKERSKAQPEDDLIIFPEDFEYKAVPQCTTGRVFVLKFKTNPRKCFFWLQEPKADKDEENCRKVNDLLANPPVPGSSRGGGASGGLGSMAGLPAELAAGLGGDGELQSILGSMNQQQLMQLLGGMGGMSGLSSLMGGRSTSNLSSDSTTSRSQSSTGVRGSASTIESQSNSSVAPPQFGLARPATAAGALPSQGGPAAAGGGVEATGRVGGAESGGSTSGGGRQGAIQLSDLQNILSSFGAAGGAEETPKDVDLSEGVNADVLIPLLANPDFQARLAPFLPPGESASTEEALRQTVRSPQLQQSLQSFSAAFSSCQLGPLIAQFGLGEDAIAAANVGDLVAFSKALETTSVAKKAEEEEKDKPMEEDK